jgi:hypothetical protein
MNTDEISQKAHSHETDLRVIGQALETLGIESFELVLDGENFVLHGGPDLTGPRKKPKPTLGFNCSG